jgi:FSR family fosmidomycin resistance protein-like MFS transporter
VNLFPLLLGLAHGISDAAAGMLVIRALLQHAPDAGLLMLLYNGLAFGFQPVTGFLLDRLDRPRTGIALGLILTATGLAVFGQAPGLGMALAGLGSSLLHAGGGSLAITATSGRASAPGVFAAFGVVGLALGSGLGLSFSPLINSIFIAALPGIALAILFFPQKRTDSPAPVHFPRLDELLLVGILLLGVGFRSFAWTGVSSPLPDFSQAALWVALAAGAGKLLGGLAADRLGWLPFALGGLSLALLLLVTGNGIPGVFFLQALTGLSLAFIGEKLPGSPALAASLVFGTGVILGGLPFILVPGGWFGTFPLILALVLAGGCYWWALRT